MTTLNPPTAGAKATVAHVEAMIRRGELPPDGRLPTERTLAELVECTRAEVRRGLAHLEASGRVTRHVGRGTFVASSAASLSDVSGSPIELMVARLNLEPQIADLAALSATREDFTEMERCLLGGDRARTYEEFESWDIALHRAFAEATHNAFIVQMLDVLFSGRNDPQWGGLKRRSFSQASCIEYRSQHRAIAEALVGRDRDEARGAMTAHLETVRNRMFQSGKTIANSP
jgi:DNA-binding FadR family transcriptional regulator